MEDVRTVSPSELAACPIDIEQLQRDEAARREEDILRSFFERKHFLDVLRLLYRDRSIRQKDLALALDVNKSVVCHILNELDAAGLVQQRKDGKCKTYHLLKKGAAYYETHFLSYDARKALPPCHLEMDRAQREGHTWPESMAMPEHTKEFVQRYLRVGAEGGSFQDALVSTLERLDDSLQKLTESQSEQTWMQDARAGMEDAEQLTRAFQEIARQNDMLIYFYMGEFQAKLEWIRKELSERRDNDVKLAASKTRHFDTILELLYQKKTILKKELVEILGITPANTSIHLSAMVKAGLLEEGKAGVYRSYHITPDGEKYYEEERLQAGSPEEMPPYPAQTRTRPEKAPRQRSVRKTGTVLNDVNFVDIMRVLYEAGEVTTMDLCARLDRPRGNVYRDMQNLTMEGFVEKEIVRHCCFYTLSEKGKSYCADLFAANGA